LLAVKNALLESTNLAAQQHPLPVNFVLLANNTPAHLPCVLSATEEHIRTKMIDRELSVRTVQVVLYKVSPGQICVILATLVNFNQPVAKHLAQVVQKDKLSTPKMLLPAKYVLVVNTKMPVLPLCMNVKIVTRANIQPKNQACC
tara:strand:- start:1575 stop:2009 length:435 start_codon:yes stop_codon:yes gene_type:complete